MTTTYACCWDGAIRAITLDATEAAADLSQYLMTLEALAPSDALTDAQHHLTALVAALPAAT
jgi:hypothetical protein